MQIDRTLQIALLVVALAIGFFAGLAASASLPVVEWIGSWQTLIAGVLAIVAAALTVQQMQRVDERQERRHAELVRMGIRADALRAARAAARSDYIADLLDTMPVFSDLPDGEGEDRLVALRSLHSKTGDWVENLERNILNHKSITSAEDLFDARMTDHLDSLRAVVKELSVTYRDLVLMRSGGVAEGAVEAHFGCGVFFQDLKYLLTEFEANLEEIGRKYRG